MIQKLTHRGYAPQMQPASWLLLLL